MKGKPHLALMVLICLVPVVAMLALPALGINVGGGAWLLLILLCPLAHLVMMRQMHGNGHGETDTENPQRRPSVHEAYTGEHSSGRLSAVSRPSPTGQRTHGSRALREPGARGGEIN